MKHNKDIIILGYAGTADECPFNTEVWSINQAGGQFPHQKIDYCFAFDKLPPEYIEEMKAIAPVISWQKYADIQYPLKEILKEFRINYFVNTVCYQAAYAIYIGTKRLSLYGCDTMLGGVWQRESKGLEFWLGIAHDRNIELVLPPKSGLLRSMQGRIYGKDGREVLLMLKERVALLNILPDNAPYNDVIHAATLKWIFNPKEDEKSRYGIHSGYGLDGKYTAVCQEEFRIDIPMSEDIWNYLRKCILDYEKEFGLTDNLLGLYEMLTTSEWHEGEYDTSIQNILG